ncbi:MAG: hypothetical protein QMC95_03775 [Desulfitobacteriaceae bacterium]|nr:hypothetical protein [Desulfitobacteriaceae bacterium]
MDQRFSEEAKRVFLGSTVDMLSAFFLICFGIGLVTSLGALLMGAHGHGDLSHGGDISHGGTFSHGGNISHAGGHGGDLSHGGDVSHGTGHGDAQAHSGELLSYFNLNTMLGFLLGFGATGFVTKQILPGFLFILILGMAVVGGLVFAAIIYSLITKVLLRGQSPYLKASDFNLVGMEGIISSTIFAGRVGEVSYVLNKSHAATPARERQGRELKKGLAVVIVEVKDGMAIVLPREEFLQYAQTKEE